MRVLLISGEYPPMQGGVADFSAILANELARQGAEVHVLTSIEAGAQARADAVRVHAILRAWRWAPLYRAVRELLRDVRPEVINIQYQAAAYGMHPAINLLPRVFPGVPAVVTFHDLKVPYLFPKAGALRWRVVLELARASRAVIVTNEEDRLQLEGRRGMPQLYQIPIGSNITTASPADDARDAWRDRWGIAPDALVLCYFGFLNPSKGGEELIEALAELRTRGYTPYLLMIGGSVGASDPTNRAYLERVRASIAQHGLEER
ncbi:MAG: glycosyltransferase, partial [Chloroflexi bacterium]|nr:glycosyltransferase [Chloroflexota bacterium]